MGIDVEKYTIDLDTILQVLGGFQQNGLLQGDLPAKKLGNKVPWKAYLRLSEGKVVSCSIVDEKEMLVRVGQDALQMLRGAGQLHWLMSRDDGGDNEQAVMEGPRRTTNVLSQYSPAPPQPQWGAFPSPLVPRRLVMISMEQMNQGRWPRGYRQVYAMIDGARTIETIASLLTLPLGSVEQILNDLQKMNIIAID
jgi:hypothetical protein